METRTADSRLRELFEASLALGSELSLDSLLTKLVETAARLTEARYAALGVIDESGEALERFITTGIDAETHAAIGDLPRGRGILGVLIRDAHPLRLARLGDDPRSVGFPPNHPPMASFLGVPVMMRGVAYGNLYLTEKAGGAEFTDEDEEIVTLLAAQAAVAIENARLYESATRWSRQLETLHEVVRSVVDETDVGKLLHLVCTRIRELTEARVALAVLSSEHADTLRVVAASADGEVEQELVGRRLDTHTSKVGRVLERRQSARVDSLLDDPDVAQDEARMIGARTGLYVPMIARGRALGVIAIHDKRSGNGRFTDADLRVAEIFTARAAVAVALSERVARDTVRRVVAAQEAERRRLALELHDETGQALTSILLGLRAIRSSKSDEDAARAEADLRELVVQALQDVRALAVELRPAALDDFGLEPALERLVHTFSEQSGIATSSDFALDGRLSPELETTLYRVVQEALTNVVKHAGAEHVSVLVAKRDGQVIATIADDGQGFSDDEVRDDALGLVGMRERVALLGGTLKVRSEPGEGTTVSAQAPLPAA
ncbi:MAG TPA: GAF domain-containing sensor histidine kinase [Gaiellaceae bacterium]|nr:GAF domain-containing sensor histidine kinase [Gaiellaceae bacterium]